MAFNSRKPSMAFQLPSSKTIEENNSMTDSQNTPSNNNMDAQIQAIFDARRVWNKSTWGIRITATAEEIKTFSPKGAFMDLLGKNKIRVTTDANGTRKDGIAVVYANSVQDKETGAALAIYENIAYFADYQVKEDGYRVILLIDTEGDHDMMIYEELNVNTGKIGYRVHYASKKYNNHGQLAGLIPGAVNKVQDGIMNSLNGWDSVDEITGAKSHVTGFNEWVDAHNLAVMKNSTNQPLTAEDQALLKNCTPDTDPNRYAQINTVKHIAYDSVVNHYVLLAWLLLAEDKPAFELFTFAKDAAGFEKFLSNRDSNLVKGYQRQLRKMAGIAYEAAK